MLTALVALGIVLAEAVSLLALGAAKAAKIGDRQLGIES